MIELLDEKRTALITHTVTKGLNPNAPMKDTNIPWLGTIPAHWDMQRLKHVTRRITVGIVVRPADLYAEVGVPCLRSLNVDPFEVVAHDLERIPDSANRSHQKSILKRGDIVVVRTGKTGVAAAVPDWAVGGNCVDLLVVSPSAQLWSAYIEQFLNSEAASAQVSQASVGAIQSHYNVRELSNIAVPVPPPAEQHEIAAALESELAALNSVTTAVQQQLTLLDEFKSALITAAVTGQVDEATLKGEKSLDDAMEEHRGGEAA